MGELINRVRVGFSIDKKLYEQLQGLSKDTMIPMSKLIDRAIEKIVEEYKNK